MLSKPIPGSSGEVLTDLPPAYVPHAATGLLHLPRFIAKCQPALYLNKAADSTPEKLGDRIEKVVTYLLQGNGPVLAPR